MRVAVIGLGRVGLPTANYFVQLGHKVSGFDKNLEVMTKLERGTFPIWESLMSWEAQKQIHLPNAVEKAVEDVDLVYIIVPTPSIAGVLSSEFVYQALDSIEKHYSGRIIVASTLDPRDADSVCNDPRIIYNPPLIRLGHVTNDLVEARVGLVGGTDSINMLAPQGLWKWTDKTKIVAGTPKTIALAKLAINVSLSMRVAWANEIASLCERYEVQTETVLRAVQSDPRIGSGYMSPGWPPSGPCLPRDLVMWEKLGYVPLATSIKDSHERTALEIVTQVETQIEETVDKPVITILGVTYNPEALDTTNSQGLAIARMCQRKNWTFTVYDPAAHKLDLGNIPITTSHAQRAVDNSNVVVIATKWPEFEKLNLLRDNKLVIDLTGSY